jgi:hypothetical protein
MGLNFNLLNFLLSKRIFDPSAVGQKKILEIGVLKNSMSAQQKFFLADKFKLPKSVFDKNSHEIYKHFGFGDITSLDNDEFENSNFSKNLNIGPGKEDDKFKGYFDLVIDGGTSEHVYNPIVCFSNYLNYLKLNGNLIQWLPLNNSIDHGLYQFSPTFLWSIESQHRNAIELNDLHFKFHDEKIYDFYWDGKSALFRSHIHGLWNGSTMANLFRFTSRDTWMIANWTKTGEINFKDLIHNTHQEIYVKQWNKITNLDTFSQSRFARKLLVHIYNHKRFPYIRLLALFFLRKSKIKD